MPELPEQKFSEEDFVRQGEQPIQEPQTTEQPEAQEPAEPARPEQQPQEEQKNQQPSEEPSQPSAEEQPESQEEPAPTEESPESQPEQETDYVQELSKITDLELNSVDDVANALSEYSQVKKDPYKYLNISSQMKAAIEAEKQGISPAKFFSLSSIDPETMNNKELLRQNYLISNPEDSDNQKFLNMQFERDYDSKYGILQDTRSAPEDFDTDAEWQKFQQDKQYAEELLAYESSKAKKSISSWKEKSLAPKAPEGPTQEEIDRQTRAYNLETDRVVKGLNNLTLKVGQENYNIGIKPEEKQRVQEALSNPIGFLKEIGVDAENNNINQSKLAQFVSLYVLRDTIADRIATHKIESKNKDIVTNRLENRRPQHQAPVHGSDTFMDELQEASALFEQKRNGAR